MQLLQKLLHSRCISASVAQYNAELMDAAECTAVLWCAATYKPLLPDSISKHGEEPD